MDRRREKKREVKREQKKREKMKQRMRKKRTKKKERKKRTEKTKYKTTPTKKQKIKDNNKNKRKTKRRRAKNRRQPTKPSVWREQRSPIRRHRGRGEEWPVTSEDAHLDSFSGVNRKERKKKENKEECSRRLEWIRKKKRTRRKVLEDWREFAKDLEKVLEDPGIFVEILELGDSKRGFPEGSSRI